ncbi:MAG: peptidylprolyl isomerase [Myxococcota bacterium]|nr:peptidylprolyl isomerase [Myxococcota bacterium]
MIRSRCPWPRAALCAAALLLASTPAPRADEILVDGIAAQVGNDVVLVSEVMEMIGPGEQRMRAAGAPEIEIAKLRAEGLETMIEWRLVEKVVRDADLQATDAEVDEMIGMIASENGITVEQLERSVATQAMSLAEYKQQIKRELERRKVINAVVATKVHLEESEVEAAYRERFSNQPEGGSQVHLRQLLVPAGQEVGRSLADSCNLVKGLRERVVSGASFTELASKYSAAAPQQGGDIGWLHQDSLASWMVAAIGPLEAGDVSQVIELPFGCTIIQLVERKEFEPVSYEQAKPALQAELYEAKIAAEYRTWMEELRSRTYIERRGYFADAASLRNTGTPATP